MLRELAAKRRVLFVGGKGGVGKTSVASALALTQAEAGRRVLVVSIDPAHNLGHVWDRRVGDEVVSLAPNLDGREIDPESATQRHLDAVAATMRRLMPEHLHRQIRQHLDLARDAPGMHEAVILELVAQTVDEGLDNYDLIVFDTAPSGHTARLMALPELMSAWTDGLLRRRERSSRLGAAAAAMDADDDRLAMSSRRDDRNVEIRRVLLRRQRLFAGLRRVLTDQALSSFIIVCAAERLPVLESIDLHRQLASSGVDVGALLVNKRSPADQGEFLARRRAQEDEHLCTLTDALPMVPLVEVPLLPGDVVGSGAIAAFAELL